MHPFSYSRSSTESAAVEAGRARGTKFVAGGTNLLDLMKEHVETPTALVDINSIPLATIDRTAGGVRIGALARMSDVAEHPAIRQDFPVIAEALLQSASPQLRNMASIGGNLLQRTRCPYFRDVTFACNKREPGTGCPAQDGDNRMHAILGTSPACIAVHTSDLAVALVALDAQLRLRGTTGERVVPLADFYREPGTTPQRENVLEPGELIVAVEVPAAAHAARSHYLKVRDRSSYEFALTSAAVGLDVAGGVIRSARVALGGVGTKPWRSREAEAALVGKRADTAAFAEAAALAVAGAEPRKHNRFKVELAKRTLVRALETVAQGGGVA